MCIRDRYITIRGKGDILAKLRKEVKKADVIYLATDPDREGEAISWHLLKALKLDELKEKKVYRISFNEITKNAVKTSLKAPREIDMDLVDAQQTRRILDRMVGYTISPLLWAKVKRGLSAGRVQSVALRMICDREDEINAFIPEEYWNLEADLLAQGSKKPLTAKFYGDKSGKMTIHNKEELDGILKKLKNKKYVVEEVKSGERVKKAPIPFTTSTLQQEASKVLNFSTQKTMRLAPVSYTHLDVYKRQVYGDPAFVPITEECPKGEITNPYGRTKGMLEQILTDLHTADPEWKVMLLRYFNPIGAHESGRIGENPKGIPNNLLPYITQVAVGKLVCLGVFGNDYDTPDGTCVRDYIHVVDLADGHVKALDKLKNSSGGVWTYNLGTGVGYSVLDVINAFEEANDLKINYVFKERRAGDVPSCYSDATKAKEELGWVAKRGIKEMCQDSWRWQKNNPEGYTG